MTRCSELGIVYMLRQYSAAEGRGKGVVNTNTRSECPLLYILYSLYMIIIIMYNVCNI